MSKKFITLCFLIVIVSTIWSSTCTAAPTPETERTERTMWMKELSEACREEGIKFGFYYSVDRDWHHPHATGDTRFTNRTHWDWLDYTQYDLRLYGDHKIEYYIIPYNSFEGKQIVSDVKAITAPTFVCEGSGHESFYSIEEDDLAITSIYPKDSKAWTRGYKMPSQRSSQYRDWEIFNTEVGSN